MSITIPTSPPRKFDSLLQKLGRTASLGVQAHDLLFEDIAGDYKKKTLSGQTVKRLLNLGEGAVDFITGLEEERADGWRIANQGSWMKLAEELLKASPPLKFEEFSTRKEYLEAEEKRHNDIYAALKDQLRGEAEKGDGFSKDSVFRVGYRKAALVAWLGEQKAQTIPGRLEAAERHWNTKFDDAQEGLLQQLSQRVLGGSANFQNVTKAIGDHINALRANGSWTGRQILDYEKRSYNQLALLEFERLARTGKLEEAQAFLTTSGSLMDVTVRSAALNGLSLRRSKEQQAAYSARQAKITQTQAEIKSVCQGILTGEPAAILDINSLDEDLRKDPKVKDEITRCKLLQGNETEIRSNLTKSAPERRQKIVQLYKKYKKKPTKENLELWLAHENQDGKINLSIQTDGAVYAMKHQLMSPEPFIFSDPASVSSRIAQAKFASEKLGVPISIWTRSEKGEFLSEYLDGEGGPKEAIAQLQLLWQATGKEDGAVYAATLSGFGVETDNVMITAVAGIVGANPGLAEEAMFGRRLTKTPEGKAYLPNRGQAAEVAEYKNLGDGLPPAEMKRQKGTGVADLCAAGIICWRRGSQGTRPGSAAGSDRRSCSGQQRKPIPGRSHQKSHKSHRHSGRRRRYH